MKIILYYETEQRSIEFDNQQIIYRFVNGYNVKGVLNALSLRNLSFTKSVNKIAELLPIEDNLSSMNRVQIYDGNELIHDFHNLTYPIYSIHTPFGDEKLAVGDVSLIEQLKIGVM